MKWIAGLVAAVIAVIVIWGGVSLFVPKAPKAPAQRQVVVGLIGGSWAERIERLVKPRMDAEGIKVVYVAGSAQDWVARLSAARGQKPPVDVFEADDQTIGKLRAAGLALPIDLQQIPNAKKLAPGMAGDGYVAYWASEPAILYNPARLKAAGIPFPRRYSDLADPRLAGKIVLPDINLYCGFYMVLGLAYENGGNADNYQPGFDVLGHIKPYAYSQTSASVAQLLNSGDVWVVVWPAHMAAVFNEAGLDLAVAHPVIDGHPVALAKGYFAVAAGSQDTRAAHVFLDAVTAPAVQTAVYDEDYILPVSEESLEHAYQTRDTAKNARGQPLNGFQKLDPREVSQAWVPELGRIDYPDWSRRWQAAVEQQSAKPH